MNRRGGAGQGDDVGPARWTRIAGAAVVLAVLPSCAIWVGTGGPRTGSYASTGRPSASYYCYDCHGYRFFDPYYDWCAGHGFHYAWDRHPETVRVYRERYLRIKEQNPWYGRYRYPSGYRDLRGYRLPRDYDSWRVGEPSGKSPGKSGGKVQEKTRREPGSRKTNQKDERDRERPPAERPRGARPAGGQRPGPPGGA
jgi:hypothetical protein